MDENKATSLDEFEKQLKQNVDGGASSLADFEQQLKSNVGTTQTQQCQKQTVKVKKNIVLSFPSDFSGCGHIRNIFPLNYITNLYGKQGSLIVMIAPFYIRQVDILARSRALFFQRQMNEQQFNIVKNYKDLQTDLKYKMVYDLDDLVFGKNEMQGGDKYSGVPAYNFGYSNIDNNIRKFCPKIMEMMDTCCLSTQYLRDYCVDKLGIQTNCVVMPNSIPKFFWGGIKRPDKTKRIEKPKVLITSSPTHYHNELKKKGDFDNAWLKWILDSVKQDRIDLVCMGGLPFFFEEIKDKIKVINWVSSFDYHNVVKNQRADICIGPLVPNDFNHSKSDIKFLESCISSTPFIGTVFTNGKPSPYDNCLLTVNDNCTVDDIEDIVDKLKEPEFHNKIKNEQFVMLEREGRYTESPEYIKKWLAII